MTEYVVIEGVKEYLNSSGFSVFTRLYIDKLIGNELEFVISPLYINANLALHNFKAKQS